ncbi:hypothetical protein RIF29_23232 [Crotalaria pallida]|uniref:Uncharacterized protein n=1 Tax=Crotalaria pallida TaxID=3830 RepID=A0AAN9F7C5_CROPI
MNIMDHADFSSYILFEATGDSEADFDPMMGGTYAYEHGRDEDDDDDDDALSCSYDVSDICIASEVNMYDESSCDGDVDDEKKEDEEIDGAYGASYCEDDEMQEENQRSYVSFDSSQDSVDEMEKNRLFWEACLAS